MSLYKDRYRLESTRLSDWDYSFIGYYYVTICTQNCIDYFGDLKTGKMVLSEMGRIAYNYWQEIPKHFPFTRLDEFVIMPNHLHGILIINDGNTTRRDAIYRVFPVIKNVSPINKTISPVTKNVSPVTEKTTMEKKGGITGNDNPMFYKSISKIIRWYKGRCIFEINKIHNNPHFSWQPRFYDHIIRTNQDLRRIRKYIQKQSG